MDVYEVEIRSSVGLSMKEERFGAGDTSVDISSYYTRYSSPITIDDKIITLVLDSEGSPIRPYRREKLLRIGTAVDYRCDRGRIEYWKLDTYKEIRKFLNGPE